MATITIPKAFVRSDDIVLIPKREYERIRSIAEMVEKSQLWFWSEEWQKREKEADADIRSGRVRGPFRNKKELRSVLARLKKGA